MIILALLAAFALLPFLTWIGYLACVALEHGGIPIPRTFAQLGAMWRAWRLWPAAVVMTVTGVMDALLNLTLATLLCVDWPRQAFLTQRMARYQRSGDAGRLAAWRRRVARAVCGRMLDPFAPGGCHCALY